MVVEVTCTSSQRDLEKIHCVVPALLESIFCNGRTRINIKRKLRNLILLVNSFWHNIMVLHTHDLMQSEHEKNTAAKQKRPFFSLSFVSDIPCNPVQSLCEGLWQRTNYYFKGSLLFKPQHSAWKFIKNVSPSFLVHISWTHCYGGIDFRLCQTIVWKWDFLTFFQPLW